MENKTLNNNYRYGEIKAEELKGTFKGSMTEWRDKIWARQKKYDKHKEICDSLNELYITKNKEYGDSFGKAYKKFGKTSAITQIYHKMERVYEIYEKDDIEYENLEDNLIDAANYIVMMLVEMEEDK